MVDAKVDGDVIRYQIGYATQRKQFTVFGKTFLTLAEANEYAYDEGAPPTVVEQEIVTDIREAVFHTVDKFIENVRVRAKADTVTIFLTGEGNYREDIATIRPYKGHRQGDKPLNYDLLTDYLVRKHKAIIIEGREADDAMACAQMEDLKKSVICTIDKDLNCIPGWHYDWKKDKRYTVSLEEADHFFYTQLLTGDGVDNIEGCPGVGAKGAKAILEGRETCRQKYEACLAAYKDSYYKFIAKHDLSCTEESVHDSAIRDMHENAHLLWIQRADGVMWEVPSE